MYSVSPALIRPLARKISAKTDLIVHAMAADAFLVSYPKSGRTWLRFMLSNYLNDVFQLGVAVDLRTMFGVIPNYDTSVQRGVRAFVGRGVRREGLPLLLCSHLPFQSQRFLRKPAVFLVRDPRDVMVSAYFHAVRHKHRFSGDMLHFLKDESYGVPALAGYLNGWAAGLRGRRHMIASYEGLSRDPVAVLREIVAFLGLPQDDDAVARAVEASRFDTMQRLEIEDGIPDHNYDRSDPDSLRMRKGAVGGHAATLAADELALLHAELSARLSPAGKRLVALSGMALD